MSQLLDPVRASVEWGPSTTFSDFFLRGGEVSAFGRKTASGEHVTPESAMGLSAYYACLRNGAEDVGKLPREVREKRAGGKTGRTGSDPVPDHPLSKVLHQPNPIMSWGVFAQVMQHRRMAWGNGYAEIVRDGMGVRELWPVHPKYIRPVLQPDGKTVVYVWSPGGGVAEKRLAPDRIFHLRGVGNGIEGYSVARLAAESLGIGIAAQKHAAAFFGEGMTRRLIAILKGANPNAAARAQLRKRITGKSDEEGDEDDDRPVGRRRLPILPADVEIKDIGINPDDAQFLEQREFGVEEVARWFRMNLAKIQYHKRAQGWASLDALNTDYVVDFLTPQVQTWEEEIAAKLLTEEERARGLFVRFVMQGLLRGDVSTRLAYYAAGFKDGWLSQNDIRDFEDMQPIDDPGADKYRVQAQMKPVGGEEGEGDGQGPKPKPPTPPPFPPRGEPEPEEEEDEEETEPEAMLAVRAESDALRPVAASLAAMLTKMEALEVRRALDRNGSNPAALAKWSETFYARLREKIVEVMAPIGLAVDAIAARHPAARVKPADLDAVAAGHCAGVDLAAVPAAVDARAAALANSVLAAFLPPDSHQEPAHAA